MPTYVSPTRDASEAAEALRGLAHASRHFEEPADTYAVLREMLGGVRAFRQVLDQLANVHLIYRSHVTDDARDPAAGAAATLATADELHQAATLMDQADDRLNAALIQSGRIVWNPDGPLVERWIDVVFLQGEEADQVIDLIDAQGADAGIDHLARWDSGDETTDAAIPNGYVHDTAPVFDGDRQRVRGDYAMNYNAQAGHVALYRRHLIPAEDAIDTPVPGGADAAQRDGGRAVARRSAIREGGWFEPAAITAVRQSRGLGL